jgi:hypothetical protein
MTIQDGMIADMLRSQHICAPRIWAPRIWAGAALAMIKAERSACLAGRLNIARIGQAK